MSTTATTNQIDITQRTDSGYYQTYQGTKSQGWPEDSNNWQHLLSSTHDNQGNYYSLQMAGGFFDNQNFYVRKTASDGNQSWRKLWHDGNFDPKKRSINVIDYGARMDGSDDSSAYQAARAATGFNGIVKVPPGPSLATIPVDPVKCVLWKLAGNTYPGGNFAVSGIGSDIVETFLPYQSGWLLSQDNTTAQSAQLATFQRVVNHTGHRGTEKGVLDTVKVFTSIQQTVDPFIYGFTSVVDDNSPGINQNGNNVAGYFQYNRYSGAVPGWSQALETADYTNTMSSQSAPLLGEEVLIKVNRADDAGRRFVQDLVVGRALEDEPAKGLYYEAAEVTAFSRCSNVFNDPNQGHAKFGYHVMACISDAAFNAAQAMWVGPHAIALRTGTGANIDLSGDATRMLRWQPGQGLEYRVNGNPVFTVRDDGVISRPDAPATSAPTSRLDPRGNYGDEVKVGDRVYFKTSSGWFSSSMIPLT